MSTAVQHRPRTAALPKRVQLDICDAAEKLRLLLVEDERARFLGEEARHVVTITRERLRQIILADALRESRL